MRRFVPTMIVAVMLFLAGGSARVHGQETCTFTQGFAELRGLVDEQKIGACLENEHFNPDNGNAEQPTTTAASSTGASASATPSPSASSAPNTAAAAPATAATAAASATPSPTTPTRTATPKPAVTAKFTERPDEVDTGSDVKYTLPADAKTGKAKAIVTITANGEPTKIEDTFEVKKGDTVYGGSIAVEVDPPDIPKDVDPGEEIKVGVDTNLKRKGSCALTMTWPKLGPVAAETQMPDDSGKCSWKMKVPADVPTKSTGSLVVTVYKDSSTYRTLTREFKVAK